MKRLTKIRLTDTDNSMVVTEGEGGGEEVEEGRGGQIHSD